MPALLEGPCNPVNAGALTMNEVQAAPAAVPALRDLVPWEDHQKANEHIFRTKESWRWFCRDHRAELIAKGAMCYLAGRIFVFPAAFDQLVVEIGCRMAAAREVVEA